MILAMVPAERTRLLKQMNGRNTETGIIAAPIELWQRLMKEIAQLEGDKAYLNYLERSNNEIAKYRRGPKERSKKTQERREIVRTLLAQGVVDPGKIRRALQDKGHKVERKTVQNDLSLIHRESPAAIREKYVP